MSRINDLDRYIEYANRSLGEEEVIVGTRSPDKDIGAHMANGALENTGRASDSLIGIIGSSDGIEFVLGDTERIINEYGREVSRRHAAATQTLHAGYRYLQDILDGTTNDHALRGLQELGEAHEASLRVDAQVQAVEQALLMKINFRMRDLIDALGAAASKVFLPFVSAEDLSDALDSGSHQGGAASFRPTCNDVIRPLREGHELIDSYRVNQLGGDPR